MKHYYLGIDLGTSALKLLLIDRNKQMIANQTIEYEVNQPYFGWREIDPNVWFDCLSKGLKNLFRKYESQYVDAIGVTGQMHTLVMLDANGDSLCPALMWDDTRTKRLVTELLAKLENTSVCDHLQRILSTGSPAVNLYWLKQEKPELFQCLSKFLIAPDYLVYRLTGKYGTDYCEASTSSLYDLELRNWSPVMKDILGLNDDVYPVIRGSAVSPGVVTADVAKVFGFRKDVPVLTGTGDNLATAISSGCLGHGEPVISLGTSGVLMMQREKTCLTAKGKEILFSPDGQRFMCLVQGALQSNGTSYEWWIRSILGIEDFNQVDHMLQQGSLHKNSDLLFFPHLMGEKTLFADPEIRGAFIGLSTLTSREDMIYAVMEGLCYGYRELAEKMGLNLNQCPSIKLVGGGSRSTSWAQILANVLNVKVKQMDGIISPAYGIALLAAYHCGKIDSFDHITDGTIKVKRNYFPQAEMQPICQRKYEQYLRIYGALKFIQG